MARTGEWGFQGVCGDGRYIQGWPWVWMKMTRRLGRALIDGVLDVLHVKNDGDVHRVTQKHNKQELLPYTISCPQPGRALLGSAGPVAVDTCHIRETSPVGGSANTMRAPVNSHHHGKTSTHPYRRWDLTNIPLVCSYGQAGLLQGLLQDHFNTQQNLFARGTPGTSKARKFPKNENGCSELNIKLWKLLFKFT